MPSIASVIPAMDHIDQHLATAATSDEYGPAIKAALAIGKKTINRYYDQTDHSEVYRIAMSIFYFISLSIGSYGSSSTSTTQARILQEGGLGDKMGGVGREYPSQ